MIVLPCTNVVSAIESTTQHFQIRDRFASCLVILIPASCLCRIPSNRPFALDWCASFLILAPFLTWREIRWTTNNWIRCIRLDMRAALSADFMRTLYLTFFELHKGRAKFTEVSLVKGCVWLQFDLFRNLFHAMRKSKFGLWTRIFQRGAGARRSPTLSLNHVLGLNFHCVWNIEVKFVNIIFYPSTFYSVVSFRFVFFYFVEFVAQLWPLLWMI